MAKVSTSGISDRPYQQFSSVFHPTNIGAIVFENRPKEDTKDIKSFKSVPF
ncbi:MAG: hypothetical protein KME50_06895 [Nostoc desertorum CM1-VF14]|nr:hypothetical protein [Nostoc desertorum CM1-VF14]